MSGVRGLRMRPGPSRIVVLRMRKTGVKNTIFGVPEAAKRAPSSVQALFS
jgi:hypothetical protein